MSEALAVMLKQLMEARWKRANLQRVPLNPTLKALVYEPCGQAV